MSYEPRIKVCSAKNIATNYSKGLEIGGEKKLFTAHISFDNSKQPGDRPKHYLHLNVFDKVPPMSDGPFMRVEHMKQLIEFVGQLDDEDVILINCQAGRSRGVAAAIIVYFMISIQNDDFEDDREAYDHALKAAEWAFQHKNKATPNGLFLKMADMMLDTGGVLWDAANRAGFVKWDYRNKRHQKKDQERREAVMQEHNEPNPVIPHDRAATEERNPKETAGEPDVGEGSDQSAGQADNPADDQAVQPRDEVQAVEESAGTSDDG